MTAWVWKPYAARRHLTLIHGPRHAGKSYVAMMIAAAVVDGAELAGVAAAAGAIAYLDRQNSPSAVIKPRLNGNGCENQHDFIWVGDAFRADNDQEYGRLSRMIGRYGLDLVVFDNLYSHRMRKPIAFQRLGALAKLHGCAVVVVMDDRDMQSGCKDQAPIVLNIQAREHSRRIVMTKGMTPKLAKPKHFAIKPDISDEYRSSLVWKSERSVHACEGV